MPLQTSKKTTSKATKHDPKTKTRKSQSTETYGIHITVCLVLQNSRTSIHTVRKTSSRCTTVKIVKIQIYKLRNYLRSAASSRAAHVLNDIGRHWSFCSATSCRRPTMFSFMRCRQTPCSRATAAASKVPDNPRYTLCQNSVQSINIISCPSTDLGSTLRSDMSSQPRICHKYTCKDQLTRRIRNHYLGRTSRNACKLSGARIQRSSRWSS